MPQVDLPPLTNKLHSYPSYIYSLSWHLLSEEEYNDIVVTQQYTPKNVMIASAGRYSPDFPRNEFFSEDFFLEFFQYRHCSISHWVVLFQCGADDFSWFNGRVYRDYSDAGQGSAVGGGDGAH